MSDRASQALHVLQDPGFEGLPQEVGYLAETAHAPADSPAGAGCALPCLLE